MTPVDRRLSGDVLAFDLAAEIRTAREELLSGPGRGGIHRLPNGTLAALDGGVRHAVSSREGGFFLLTLAGAARAEVGPG